MSSSHPRDLRREEGQNGRRKGKWCERFLPLPNGLGSKQLTWTEKRTHSQDRHFDGEPLQWGEEDALDGMSGQESIEQILSSDCLKELAFAPVRLTVKERRSIPIPLSIELELIHEIGLSRHFHLLLFDRIAISFGRRCISFLDLRS